jgi:hypothetical protein
MPHLSHPLLFDPPNKTHILVFWVVTLCSLAGGYQDCGENIASIFNCQIIQCHDQENYNMNFLQHENLKYNILIFGE